MTWVLLGKGVWWEVEFGQHWSIRSLGSICGSRDLGSSPVCCVLKQVTPPPLLNLPSEGTPSLSFPSLDARATPFTYVGALTRQRQRKGLPLSLRSWISLYSLGELRKLPWVWEKEVRNLSGRITGMAGQDLHVSDPSSCCVLGSVIIQSLSAHHTTEASWDIRQR